MKKRSCKKIIGSFHKGPVSSISDEQKFNFFNLAIVNE